MNCRCAAVWGAFRRPVTCLHVERRRSVRSVLNHAHVHDLGWCCRIAELVTTLSQFLLPLLQRLLQPRRGKVLRCCSESAPSGFRTPDPLIKSQLLYQLS